MATFDSKKRTFRSCAVQAGKPSLPKRTSTRGSNKSDTPLKRKVSKRKLDIPELPKLKINSLPGKNSTKVVKKSGETSSSCPKQQKSGASSSVKKTPSPSPKSGRNQRKPLETRTSGKTSTPSPNFSDKCAVCNRTWDSKEDTEFRKKVGTRKASWIGCDVKQCKYWGHAVCTNIQLIPRKKLSMHNFLCPKHRK